MARASQGTLATVLLLAALVAAGWMLVEERGAGVQAADRPGPVAPDAQDGLSAVGGSPELTPDGTGPGARTPIDVLAPVEEQLPPTQVAEEDEAPPHVVGRVVGADGAPLADARVIAATGWTEAVPLEVVDLGDASSWYVRAEGVSGPDGRFAVAGDLQPGQNLSLHVVAAGHAPLRVDLRALRVPAPQDVGDLTLRAGRIARGRVVLRSGAPVPGAEIQLAVVRGEQGFPLDFPSRGVPMATSDAEGCFTLDRLDDGPFSLLVAAPNSLVARATGTASALPVEDLVVVVDPGSTVAGRVVGLPDELELELRVEARPGKPDNSQVDGLERAHRGARAAGLGEDGAFEVTGLVDGLPHTLVLAEREALSGAWKRVGDVEPVVAWPGTSGVELRWDRGRGLVLRVVDGETGEPVAGPMVAWLSTVKDRRGNERWRPLRAPQATDGAPQLQHTGGQIRFEQVPGRRRDGSLARVAVRLRAIGFADREVLDIALDPEEETDLGDVALERGPVVRVRVTDRATGAPVRGAQVYLHAAGKSPGADWFMRRRQAWSNTDGRYGETDEAGLALLPGPEAGRFELVATSAEHVPSEVTPLEVTAGVDAEAELELGIGGTLLVRVQRPSGRPAAGVKVYVRAKQKDANEGRQGSVDRVTDDAGEARFEQLPEPIYEVLLAGEDRRPGERATWREVRVAPGEESLMLLDAPAVGVLVGTVFENSVGLARATLQLSGEGISSNRWFNNGPSATSATTRGDGSYTLGPVATGEYELTLQHDSRAMGMKVPVTIREGDNPLDVRLGAAVIEGRIVDAETGLPVEGVRAAVMAGGEDLGGGTSRITMTESASGEIEMSWDWRSTDSMSTGRDGAFAFRGVATGFQLMVVLSDSYIVQRPLELGSLTEGELRDLGELQVEAAGCLRVTLTGGTPGERYRVRARWTGPERPDTGLPSVRLRVGRRATLSSLRPGPYVLEMMGSEGEVLAQREVEVRARERLPVEIAP